MAQKFLSIDADKIKNKIGINIQKQIDKIGKKIIKKASYALFEHIKELADQELNTRKQFYKNNLQIKEDSKTEGYRIVLKKPAGWIEKGMDAHQLRDSMLKSGQKSRVIPLSDAILVGTNKARKVAAASSVKFRTMSLNQVSSMWNVKTTKGAELFKKSIQWFKSQLKNGTFTKK